MGSGMSGGERGSGRGCSVRSCMSISAGLDGINKTEMRTWNLLKVHCEYEHQTRSRELDTTAPVCKNLFLLKTIQHCNLVKNSHPRTKALISGGYHSEELIPITKLQAGESGINNTRRRLFVTRIRSLPSTLIPVTNLMTKWQILIL